MTHPRKALALGALALAGAAVVPSIAHGHTARAVPACDGFTYDLSLFQPGQDNVVSWSATFNNAPLASGTIGPFRTATASSFLPYGFLPSPGRVVITMSWSLPDDRRTVTAGAADVGNCFPAPPPPAPPAPPVTPAPPVPVTLPVEPVKRIEPMPKKKASKPKPKAPRKATRPVCKGSKVLIGIRKPGKSPRIVWTCRRLAKPKSYLPPVAG